ncbi:hypothetical protein J7355_17060 [Endozoicomonas sp. G2_2]|uniref:hypothetical protein n=1 Tax=Endozoicomonas sp. G2_2 TaxID=2821092 RepID=UPI001ADBB333|nr:hypothetical protein [Endozoicomonas sp. G2_2]MBO9471804.1 hypothetical protein [Endozoicomonas sp. G2_2]
MKQAIALLVVLLGVGCDSLSTSASEIRHALLVNERIQLAKSADPTAIEAASIRDLVVHGSARIGTDGLEARVTYTSVHADASIRRDRRVFLRRSGPHYALVGQCRWADKGSCAQLRRRASAG